jgi:RNA polymerase sigma-70 factor (ECF subfamily)
MTSEPDRQDPDRALVEALKSPDAEVRRQALSDLYDRHHQRVFHVAYRVLGHAVDAQDVMQEVFLHLADRLRSFRGDASLSSWVYRVTVNRAIDARRRRSRRPTPWGARSDDDGDDAAGPGKVAAPVPDPGETTEQAERDERVRGALDHLSPKLRAVVILRYFENLSYEELAEVLGVNMGTVKSRLNRAHAALERLLGRLA